MAEIHISRTGFLAAAVASPGYRAFALAKANELKEAAEQVFKMSQRSDNEDRESETTPPKYLQSWNITVDADGVVWLINEDPAAAWVEFGARAGGRTPVLKYRPLGRALEIVANREGVT